MAKRRCTGTTRKGLPCTVAPLKGTERCAAHPLSPDSPRFGSPAQAREAGLLGGRPPKPRPADVMRELIEDNINVLLDPYFRALGYEVIRGDDGPLLVKVDSGGAKLHATFEGEVLVSAHDDLAAMQSTAERLLDRVYGKPKQSTELTGAGGGPIETSARVDLSQLSIKERDQLEQLLERAAAPDGPAVAE